MSDSTTETEEMFYTDDMSQIAAADENVPEGQYHFRVSDVKKYVSDKAETLGEITTVVVCKIQTEGAAFGRSININCAMDGKNRNFGLATLKSLYKAVGKIPQGPGHNPQTLLDGEFVGTVKWTVSKGVTYSNIAGYTIKSLIG